MLTLIVGAGFWECQQLFIPLIWRFVNAPFIASNFWARRVYKTRLPLGNKSGLQSPPTMGCIPKLTLIVRLETAHTGLDDR